MSKEEAAMPKKAYKAKLKERKYPSIAYELAEEIQKKTDQEVRITVPGHTQRGGSPCPYDRVLATRLGAAAAELILKEEYGKKDIDKKCDNRIYYKRKIWKQETIMKRKKFEWTGRLILIIFSLI